MPDGMSFDKYIDNPAGGSSVITNRRMYKNMYMQKFDAVLLREQGQITFKVYKAKDKYDSYYIHMKIPSEVVPKFYYDVVIRLYTTQNSKKNATTIRNYAVGFYSNDPAFVFTFAYSFAKNKLFIDDLSPKMSRKALTTKASTRNPTNQVWYVKSLYFAYLTMEKYNLFDRGTLDRLSKPYNVKTLLKDIEHADKKIKDRQEKGAKIEAEKRAEARKARKEEEKRNVGIATPAVKTSARTATTKTTKTTKRSGTTRTSKITTANKKS